MLGGTRPSWRQTGEGTEYEHQERGGGSSQRAPARDLLVLTPLKRRHLLASAWECSAGSKGAVADTSP